MQIRLNIIININILKNNLKKIERYNHKKFLIKFQIK